jgi:hypothetical protein
VQDLVFGPDGNLYVTHYWPSEAIVRYNGTTGAFMSVFVSSYGLPASLAFGPDDNLWVALYHGSLIKRYNITTGADLKTISLPWPAGVAFGPDGNLYATERYVNMGGKVERYNGTTGALMGGFAAPLGGVQTELGLQWFPPRDLVAPTASPTQLPAANGAGWNNSDVTVTWNWADNAGGSGIDNANCTTSSVSSGEGAALPLHATCKDLVGNTGNASYTVKVDKTPPTITSSQVPAANGAGWNNSDVSVSFNCADALSRVASCTSSQNVTAQGTTTVTGTAIDLAGNTVTATRTVKIDKTPPVATCSATPGVLWPPNKKMVDITLAVNVSDGGAGAGGFTLLSVTSNELDPGSIQDFTIGTPDVTGRLRADRLGTGNGRVYTFVYQFTDVAGNSGTCSPQVVVPHDQGN